jgi:hypothetical protein
MQQIAIKRIKIKFERKIKYRGMKYKRNSNLINYFKKSFQLLKKGIGKKYKFKELAKKTNKER